MLWPSPPCHDMGILCVINGKILQEAMNRSSVEGFFYSCCADFFRREDIEEKGQMRCVPVGVLLELCKRSHSKPEFWIEMTGPDCREGIRLLTSDTATW